jgi:hypothetical protein
LAGFAFDLPPGASRDTPAGQLQALLSPAIMVERGVGVVKAATVRFHDQPGITPEEIGLESTIADIE